MCQGGICRRTTFSLIDRAHGRASLYVRRDIGAIEPGRWQFWHDRWKIGATSLGKVPGFVSAASTIVEVAARAAIQVKVFVIMHPSGAILSRWKDRVKRRPGQSLT